MKYIYEQRVDKQALEFILENYETYDLGSAYHNGEKITEFNSVLSLYTTFLNNLNDNGSLKVEYKKNGLTDRLWGNPFGITGISRKIRHTIASKYNIDIDIKNCHPVFLLKYCQDNNIDSPKLHYYCVNRDQILKECIQEIKSEDEMGGPTEGALARSGYGAAYRRRANAYGYNTIPQEIVPYRNILFVISFILTKIPSLAVPFAFVFKFSLTYVK
jgi:hypothetical protein